MTTDIEAVERGLRNKASFDALSVEGSHVFSQLGEDLSILHLLGYKSAGRYVDVGSHPPFRFSNTALLHRDFGWSGINIDADARAIEAFNEHRPHDINLHLAVGKKNEWVDLAIFEEGAVNTVIPKVYSKAKERWGEPTMTPVRMRRLRDILDEHLAEGESVDFLNVDVEGLDLPVLQSMDWRRYRPAVVAVEIHRMNLTNPWLSKTVRYMRSRGYRLSSFAVATAIFSRV